jgi:hypothetical protein
MPGMKLFEKVRIDFKQVNRSGIRQPDSLHEAQQKKQVVQFQKLMAEVFFIAGKRKAMNELAESGAKLLPSHGLDYIRLKAFLSDLP